MCCWKPYGGQALGFSVAETTRLTALLAGGTLIGFGIASTLLSQGGAPHRLGLIGALIGIPGFAAIILSSFGLGPIVFLAGTLLTGLGVGLFGHATLTATMRAAPRNQNGLALGTWGAVQATAAGVGVALAGIVRDVILSASDDRVVAPHMPYNAVFLIEVVFLLLACAILLPAVVKRGYTPRPKADRTDRAPDGPHEETAEAT